MTAPTPTPRTDAEAFNVINTDRGVVHADFARTLERELFAAEQCAQRHFAMYESAERELAALRARPGECRSCGYVDGTHALNCAQLRARPGVGVEPVAEMVAVEDGMGTVICEFYAGMRPPAGSKLYSNPPIPAPPAQGAISTDVEVPKVIYDLFPATVEGAIRDKLIELGWTPPAQPAEQGEGGVVANKLKGIAAHMRACYPLLQGDADVLDEAIAALTRPPSAQKEKGK